MADNIPFPVRAVGYLYIFIGVLDIISMLLSLLFDCLTVDFIFLFIFLGRGILRLEEGSRIWGVRLAKFYYFFAALFLVLMVVGPGELKVNMWGYHPEGAAEIISALLMIFTVLGIAVYVHRVLVKEEYMKLFAGRIDISFK